MDFRHQTILWSGSSDPPVISKFFTAILIMRILMSTFRYTVCEIIWNNTNIKFMNEALYFKDWVDNGILQAKQLIESGSWKNHEQIKEIMRSNSLLISFQCGKIKWAFPRVWFEQLCKRQWKQYTQDVLYNQEVFQTNTGETINLVSVKNQTVLLVIAWCKKMRVKCDILLARKVEHSSTI